MKRYIAILLAVLVLSATLVGCTQDSGNVDKSELDVDTTVTENDFDFSSMFDTEGKIKDLKAAEYVKDLLDYNNIEFPEEVLEVEKAVVDREVSAFLGFYNIVDKVYDRPIEAGDLVNIDYVGYTDGKKFEGGDTQERGTSVIAGSNDYIDDFLHQIIGYAPGEEVDVEVTFPADYGSEELAGKDAVFKTVINHIEVEGELTDELVVEYMEPVYGWKTVKEALEGMEDNIRRSKVSQYIDTLLTEQAEKVDPDNLPEGFIGYFDQATEAVFLRQAERVGITADEYVKMYAQANSLEELIEEWGERNKLEALKAVVVQAIVEKEGLQVTDEEVPAYIEKLEPNSTETVEETINIYGMPYVKHILTYHKVLDYIIDNAGVFN